MKPAKKTIVLSMICLAIIILWVLPHINKGEQTRYVRYYEDTSVPLASTAADSTGKRHRKAMRKEIIELQKTRRVNAKMFSRAMQFEPLVEFDSLAKIAERDSLSIVQ